MQADRWGRIKEVFSEAIDRPEEERASFVEGACGGDLEMRREVEVLMLAHADSEGFLSGPASEMDEGPELEGRRIGPYRILSEVGRGGMGLVYRAVRDDDVFQKIVALKLVHGGANPEERRRFTQERRILARLQHPNVANIMDGGTSDEGQPYLVMEYVEGEPIDVYCRQRELPVRDRLLMFRKVCDAVHSAHQNLVVHRDLKPGNVLVTEGGEPKLLDFGIAKMMEGDESTTATLSPRLTPAYASPEQVLGRPVTTATDVYALGVVLYELLADKHPYSTRGDGIEKVMKAVCDVDPPAPSSVSPLRGVEDDLDTIVSKAMRKEPEHRYLSAQELSEDVRRYVEGLPVLARGDTLAYRASRFARRHWVAAATLLLLAASLVLGLVATLWQWRRAEANRVRAEERLADVRALANSFLFEFHDAIVNLPGSTAARQLVVERAAEYLDRLALDAPGDVGLKRSLASAYQRLGEAQGGSGEGNLGDTEGAMKSYEKARAIREALVQDPGAPEDIEGMAYLEMKMSRVFGFQGNWQKAEEAALSTTRRLESLVGKTEKDYRGRIATAYHALGFLQARGGKTDDAIVSLRRAVDEGLAFAKTHPDDVASRANTARHQADLLEQLERRGDVAEARKLALATWSLLEELVAEDPNNTRYRRDLSYAINIGSSSVEKTGSLPEANRARARSLAISRELLAADPTNQGDRIGIGYSLQNLGAGLVRAGEGEQGLAYLEEAASTAAEIARFDPSPFPRTRLAEIQGELGKALHLLGVRSEEMCAALKESVGIWADLESRGELPGESASDYAATRALLADCR
jgi:non-specific serine/threonine protein kinase/serine/threonine-protein kinase